MSTASPRPIVFRGSAETRPACRASRVRADRKRENASGQHLGDQEMPLTLIERQPVRVADGIGDPGERFAVG